MAIRLVLRNTLQFYALFPASRSRKGLTFALSTVKLTKKAQKSSHLLGITEYLLVFLNQYSGRWNIAIICCQSPRPASAVCSIIYFLVSTTVAKKKKKKLSARTARNRRAVNKNRMRSHSSVGSRRNPRELLAANMEMQRI